MRCSKSAETDGRSGDHHGRHRFSFTHLNTSVGRASQRRASVGAVAAVALLPAAKPSMPFDSQTGAIVGVGCSADDGDAETSIETLLSAAEQIEAVHRKR
jgi:hypothetical protein